MWCTMPDMRKRNGRPRRFDDVTEDLIRHEVARYGIADTAIAWRCHPNTVRNIVRRGAADQDGAREKMTPPERCDRADCTCRGGA